MSGRPEALDFVVFLAGMVVIFGGMLFAGKRGRFSPRSGPRAAWPWVVGVPILLILGCLAYFVFS
jgi:hypothetical protein